MRKLEVYRQARAEFGFWFRPFRTQTRSDYFSASDR
jgi:hypothetical protein